MGRDELMREYENTSRERFCKLMDAEEADEKEVGLLFDNAAKDIENGSYGIYGRFFESRSEGMTVKEYKFFRLDRALDRIILRERVRKFSKDEMIAALNFLQKGLGCNRLVLSGEVEVSLSELAMRWNDVHYPNGSHGPYDIGLEYSGYDGWYFWDKGCP